MRLYWAVIVPLFGVVVGLSADPIREAVLRNTAISVAIGDTDASFAADVHTSLKPHEEVGNFYGYPRSLAQVDSANGTVTFARVGLLHVCVLISDTRKYPEVSSASSADGFKASVRPYNFRRVCQRYYISD